jgi:Acetyltransferases, including N-acetylases of ribosomal proteins
MFSHAVNNDLELTLLESRHSDELYNLVDKNRKFLREWLSWVDGTINSDQTKISIATGLKAFSENNGFQLAVFYKKTMVGRIGLHGIDWNNKKTSIGYWLGEEFQGNGIMTVSCKAVVNYLFDELLLNRVEIRVATFNNKSRAIPERLKFVNEGIIRQAERLYDRYVDHVIYGMLKEDWLKLRYLN